MTTAVEFDPNTASLVADPTTFEALFAHGAPGTPARTPDPGRDALRAAEALSDDGRLHPGLAGALDVLREPTTTLRLSYAGRSAEAWVAGAVAVLLMPPAADGRRTMLRLHPSLLPEAVARAVDLGPRPLPTAPRRMTDLAADDGVVRWWMLHVGRPGADAGGRALEVVDTDRGYYVVDHAAGVALPARPTGLWRLLVRALVGTRTDGLAPLPAEVRLPDPRG